MVIRDDLITSLQEKAKRNQDYWGSAEIFTELRKWTPRKSFQKGEYTTSQVAEEFGTTSGTVIKWCQEGAFGPGNAWQDDVHKWWHITEVGVFYLMQKVNARNPKEVVKNMVRKVINDSKQG